MASCEDRQDLLVERSCREPKTRYGIQLYVGLLQTSPVPKTPTAPRH